MEARVGSKGKVVPPHFSCSQPDSSRTPTKVILFPVSAPNARCRELKYVKMFR